MAENFHMQWKCCNPGIADSQAPGDQETFIEESSRVNVRNSACFMDGLSQLNKILCSLTHMRSKVYLTCVYFVLPS
jgi:hypothetical protein